MTMAIDGPVNGIGMAEAARDHLIAPDGTAFRDLNGNGVMEPYENPRLPITARVEDLLARMTVEEKAGLMFHTIIEVGEGGEPSTTPTPMSAHSHHEFVDVKLMNHFNVLSITDVRDAARWQNAMQELAAETRLGIPITLSSDPRHAFTQNVGAAIASGVYSQWPENLGLAALRDADLVAEFADIARTEYTALGIRAALHPTIDLATDPRWARQFNTFGQDADLATSFVLPYLRGFQGDSLGHASVACTAKHFPGGGPQKDGEDPHFPYGREQVYPGGRFEEHLGPFRAAIKAGVSAIMPYYGMPVGLVRNNEVIEEVGFAFNRQIITALLREELKYDGVVCTDWAIINDQHTRGHQMTARAWGVESLTPSERTAKAIAAGVDQFGGESTPELIVDLVQSGQLAEPRLDESVRRLLTVKFALGLFDNPYVDEDLAVQVVGNPDFRAAGQAAQRGSYTVLTNTMTPANGRQAPTLPLRGGARIYAPGLDPELVADYGYPVATPELADVALLRLHAPWEKRNTYFLEDKYHAGSLEFPPEEIGAIRAVTQLLPTVIDVYLDRPAILTDLANIASALLVNYGATDAAFLDVVFGAAEPLGRLPFQIPRSMEAVRASREDVAGDTTDPLFPFGHGLSI